jgi:hypothetical protein
MRLPGGILEIDRRRAAERDARKRSNLPLRRLGPDAQ